MAENVDSIGKLLFDFSNSVDKRSFILFLGFEEVTLKVLEWNYIIWKQNWNLLSNDEDKKEWIQWHMLLDISRTTINKIAEQALKEGQFGFTFSFFKSFQKHVNLHYNDYVQMKGGKRYYIEDLFNVACKIIFGKLQEATESRDFWSQFPAEWKVTKTNLQAQNNFVPRIMLREYFDWMLPRIEGNKDFDVILNTVTVNLFPEVDPDTWAKVLILRFSAYGENRVQSMIERRWNFGFRFPTAFALGSQSMDEIFASMRAKEAIQVQNAYDLALFLFPETFNKQSLTGFIEESGRLTYPADSKEEHKKQRLLEIFNGLLSKLA
jgi:hypothetical protein